MTDILIVIVQSIRILAIGIGFVSVLLMCGIGSIMIVDERKTYQNQWRTREIPSENVVRSHKAGKDSAKNQDGDQLQEELDEWSSHFFNDLNKQTGLPIDPKLDRYIFEQEYANVN